MDWLNKIERKIFIRQQKPTKEKEKTSSKLYFLFGVFGERENSSIFISFFVHLF